MALVLLGAVIALLQIDPLPSWLAWCPPWLAVVIVAVLGVFVAAAERWQARHHIEADREWQVIARLLQHGGRQQVIFPHVGQVPATALALRVHPVADGQSATLPQTATLANARRAWWRRLLNLKSSAPNLANAADADLPLFVERDLSPQVSEWMRQARVDGGFLILVGDSCVGKTRQLYEAARRELSDFVVCAPDLGDGGLINTIAEAAFELPKLIVWLDELQRFLPGPYLSEGATPITAAAVRRLLDAPSPVVIVGTLWPTYAANLRTADNIPNAAGERHPRYPEAIDILTLRHVREIRLDTFSSTERATATRLAAQDHRLAAAVADPDYNVTEALAGARELIGRFQRATTTQRAVLLAAIDARRLGIQAPLTGDLLRDAAFGYLPNVQHDDAWFPVALHELTSNDRPQDKATAPLIPTTGSDRRAVLGYMASDFLLQHLAKQRRTEPVPGETWQAFVAHTYDHPDVRRLADNAANRLLYGYASSLYQRLVDAGDWYASVQLVHLFILQGRKNEALEVLRRRADAGDRGAALELHLLLRRYGHVDELRVRADTGDMDADELLANLLADQGRIDELRARADAGAAGAVNKLIDMLDRQGHTDEMMEFLHRRADVGDSDAGRRLADLLAKQGRVDELRVRADMGDGYATRRLANLLADKGNPDEATEILRGRADAGDSDAAKWLADLLAKQGRVDELRARADVGDSDAGRRLADLLAKQGRIDELRARADIGDSGASRALVDLLANQGYIDELRDRADAGNEDADWRLAALLADQGCIDELRTRADTGSRDAARQVANLLAEQGRIDDTIAVLQPLADAGDFGVAWRVVNLLAEHDRISDLRERADAGDERAGRRLADLLAEKGLINELRDRADAGDYDAITNLSNLLVQQQQIDELFAEVQAGIPFAAEIWIKALDKQGKSELAKRVRKYGLNPDGSAAAPSNPQG